MQPHFWLERWEKGQIGFHQQTFNRYLLEQWATLAVEPGAKVFVPLCGKSLDILWLRDQGHPVVGVELSETAITALFDENGIVYRQQPLVDHTLYRGDGLELYAGDLFAMTPAMVDGVGGLYDRAALVALPAVLRRRYAATLTRLLAPGTPLLLVTLEYPEGVLEGPPFSVDRGEIEALFGDAFTIDERGVWEAEGPKEVAVLERVYALLRNG